MHDRLAMTLQDDLTQRIVDDRARGVLIDISVAGNRRLLHRPHAGNIAAMSRVLDAETVVVGMRPAVAITLVELGLSLPGVRTALMSSKGMRCSGDIVDERRARRMRHRDGETMPDCAARTTSCGCGRR